MHTNTMDLVLLTTRSDKVFTFM